MEGTTRYVDCITNYMNVTSLTDVIVISVFVLVFVNGVFDISCVSEVFVNGVFDISCVSEVFVNGVFDISWVV